MATRHDTGLIEDVRRAYDEGEGIRGIADMWSLPYSTVWRIATRNGRYKAGRKHLRGIDRAEVRKLRDEGHTFADIGDILGCRAESARRIYSGIKPGGQYGVPDVTSEPTPRDDVQTQEAGAA